MTLIVYYRSEKLTVPVLVEDIAVGNVSSLDLSCTIPASEQTARPPVPEPAAKPVDLHEDRLWSVTETFIRAQPIKGKGATHEAPSGGDPDLPPGPVCRGGGGYPDSDHRPGQRSHRHNRPADRGLTLPFDLKAFASWTQSTKSLEINLRRLRPF